MRPRRGCAAGSHARCARADCWCESADNKTLLKVVNEIVHVYETREQIEFKDQTPLLEINPSKNGGNTH